MKLFSKQKAAPPRVQLRSTQTHPFSLIDSYVPLGSAETRLYRMIREAVPVVDAAIFSWIFLLRIHIHPLRRSVFFRRAE